MGQYINRSLRYLLKLAVLLALIYGLMFATGMARVSANVFFNELFSSRNGRFLILMLFLLALVYPKFGFVKRVVKADLEADREEILRAFALAGYAMTSFEDGVMTFRASSLSKRVINMFDDKITVMADEGRYITIDGVRKEVVHIEFRIKSYVDNKTR